MGLRTGDSRFAPSVALNNREDGARRADKVLHLSVQPTSPSKYFQGGGSWRVSPANIRSRLRSIATNSTTPTTRWSTRSGAVRPHYQHLYEALLELAAEELRRRQQIADLSFLHQGITFTVYGRDEGTERIFPNDLLPRILTQRGMGAHRARPGRSASPR